MCICALVFSSLEKENDQKQYELYQGLKKSYKRKYNMSEDDFMTFVTDASILYKRVHTWQTTDFFWVQTIYNARNVCCRVCSPVGKGQIKCKLCTLW